MEDIITLACGVCKRRNYTTVKNKKNDPDRIELSKYCKWCHKHTEHKETKKWGSQPTREQSSGRRRISRRLDSCVRSTKSFARLSGRPERSFTATRWS